MCNVSGVFSWITVNFMLGRLGGNLPPLAALDMGGGSTQITFVPTRKVGDPTRLSGHGRGFYPDHIRTYTTGRQPTPSL